MKDVIRKSKSLARRMTVVCLAKQILRSLFYCLCAFCAVLVVDKLFYFHAVWYELLLCFAVLSIPLGVMLAMRVGITPFKAALAADERLGLHERLTSALAISDLPAATAAQAGPDTPAAKAVIADAVQHAKRVRPREVFPFCLPKECKFFVIPIAIALLTTFAPSVDLLGRAQKQEIEKVEKEEVVTQGLRLETKVEQLRMKADKQELKETADMLDKMAELSKDLREGSQDKKNAMVKLSKLSDQIKERQQKFEKMKGPSNSLKDAKGLKLTENIRKKLEEGDYKDAAKALAELKDKLEKGKLSKEDMKRLEKELKKLAEAIGNEKNMPNGMKKIAKSLAKAAEKMAAGDVAKALQQLKTANMNLDELKKMADEMELLELALNDIEEAKNEMFKGGVCKNCGRPKGECKGSCKGDWAKFYFGSKRTGKIRGKRYLADPMAVKHKDKKVKGQLQPGEILASIRVKGVPPAGEISTEYMEVFSSAKKEAEDALAKQPIPLGYKEQVKSYFDSIEPEMEE